MSLWTRLFGRVPSAAPAVKPSAPLRVEHLEDRSVPAVLDLTAVAAAGDVNGARFEQFDGRTVSPGRLDTFVRLHAWGKTAQGFNTNARPLQFQEDWGRHTTHAVKVSDLPAVTVNGVTYRQVVLDVTQPAHSPLVSLDELRLYVSNSPSPGKYRTGTLGGLAPVYDLDAGGDNWVKLNARRNGGNTRGDMLLYVPDALLSGGVYLHLYSKFGSNSSAQCGSMSWSFGRCGPVGTPPTPPPPPAGTASISGVVFQDYNDDGVRDADEPLVTGRVVWLDANSNGLLDAGERSTTTDANGTYRFETLTDGAYNVRSISDNGDPTSVRFVNVAPGETLTGVDVGLYFVNS